jgi:hypothetical protein
MKTSQPRFYRMILSGITMLFMQSCSSLIRVDKRHYRNGYYTSIDKRKYSKDSNIRKLEDSTIRTFNDSKIQNSKIQDSGIETFKDSTIEVSEPNVLASEKPVVREHYLKKVFKPKRIFKEKGILRKPANGGKMNVPFFRNTIRKEGRHSESSTRSVDGGGMMIVILIVLAVWWILTLVGVSSLTALLLTLIIVIGIPLLIVFLAVCALVSFLGKAVGEFISEL